MGYGATFGIWGGMAPLPPPLNPPMSIDVIGVPASYKTEA